MYFEYIYLISVNKQYILLVNTQFKGLTNQTNIKSYLTCIGELLLMYEWMYIIIHNKKIILMTSVFSVLFELKFYK